MDYLCRRVDRRVFASLTSGFPPDRRGFFDHYGQPKNLSGFARADAAASRPHESRRQEPLRLNRDRHFCRCRYGVGSHVDQHIVDASGGVERIKLRSLDKREDQGILARRQLLERDTEGHVIELAVTVTEDSRKKCAIESTWPQQAGAEEIAITIVRIRRAPIQYGAKANRDIVCAARSERERAGQGVSARIRRAVSVKKHVAEHSEKTCREVIVQRDIESDALVGRIYCSIDDVGNGSSRHRARCDPATKRTEGSTEVSVRKCWVRGRRQGCRYQYCEK